MTPSLVLQVLGTSAGIFGAILGVFKKRGCWIAFTVSNISFISLFLIEGLYVPILQYMVFMAINFAGWRRWTRDAKKQA